MENIGFDVHTQDEKADFLQQLRAHCAEHGKPEQFSGNWNCPLCLTKRRLESLLQKIEKRSHRNEPIRAAKNSRDLDENIDSWAEELKWILNFAIPVKSEFKWERK